MKPTNRNSHQYSFLLGGLFVLILLGCERPRERGEPLALRLGHGSVEGKPLFETAKMFAELVNREADSGIRVDVYGQSMLGDSRMAMESAAIGTLDMSCEAPLSPIVPEMALLELPYLFISNDHAAENLDGAFGRALAKRAESRGLVVLGYYTQAGRNIFNRYRDVRTPEDLDGLKIRVPEGRVWLEMMNRFGASATPLSWGEVYTGIEQSVIAGAETDLISIERAHFYETCKYISETRHVFLVYPHIINRDVFESLSKPNQQLLKRACRKASTTQRALLQARLDEARTKLKSYGVSIVQVDQAKFREKVLDMHRRYARELDAEDLLDLITPPKKKQPSSEEGDG